MNKLDRQLLAAVKKAFVPSPGGQPVGVDPGAMSGSLPPGMDPAAMGGSLPPGMDPAAMGGALPPGVDPAAMEGALPPGVDPAAMGGGAGDLNIDPALLAQLASAANGNSVEGGAAAPQNADESSVVQMTVNELIKLISVVLSGKIPKKEKIVNHDNSAE